MSSPVITTYSGKLIDPFSPDPQKINIEDIATALSKVCRWNGHINKFFSVAQHSVYVSYMVPQDQALLGLLHDSTEAYLGDMINPVKHMGSMGDYIALENLFGEAIAKRFDLPTLEKTPEVEEIDHVVLCFEAVNLGRSVPTRYTDLYRKYKGWLDLIPFDAWSPQDAQEKFLRRYEYLKLWQKQTPLVS
jgi:hypothetical protein